MITTIENLEKELSQKKIDSIYTGLSIFCSVKI